MTHINDLPLEVLHMILKPIFHDSPRFRRDHGMRTVCRKWCDVLFNLWWEDDNVVPEKDKQHCRTACYNLWMGDAQIDARLDAR